jgi:hypothetical protein
LPKGSGLTNKYIEGFSKVRNLTKKRSWFCQEVEVLPKNKIILLRGESLGL